MLWGSEGPNVQLNTESRYIHASLACRGVRAILPNHSFATRTSIVCPVIRWVKRPVGGSPNQWPLSAVQPGVSTISQCRVLRSVGGIFPVNIMRIKSSVEGVTVSALLSLSVRVGFFLPGDI